MMTGVGQLGGGELPLGVCCKLPDWLVRFIVAVLAAHFTSLGVASGDSAKGKVFQTRYTLKFCLYPEKWVAEMI